MGFNLIRASEVSETNNTEQTNNETNYTNKFNLTSMSNVPNRNTNETDSNDGFVGDFNLTSMSNVSDTQNNSAPNLTNTIVGPGDTSSLITSDLNKIFNQLTRDYYRGKSFNMAGKWATGTHYFCDDFVQDWVSFDRYLLACQKNHLSTDPPVIIFDEYNNAIGVEGDEWEFVVGGGTLMTEPFVYVQETPVNVWFIQHNMHRTPTVVIKDENHEEIIAEVTYVNQDLVMITFSEPVSGMASLL